MRYAYGSMVADPFLEFGVLFQKENQLVGSVDLLFSHTLTYTAACARLQLLLLKKKKPEQNPRGCSGIGRFCNRPCVQITKRLNMVGVGILNASNMKLPQHRAKHTRVLFKDVCYIPERETPTMLALR